VNVNDSIKHYYTVAQAIENQTSDENIEDLYDRLDKIEHTVLRQFGLPDSVKFSSILRHFAQNDFIDDSMVEEVVVELRTSAEDFLSKPAQSDLQVLTQAQKEENTDPLDIIADLGIPAHDYTLYLIDTELLENKSKPEEVLSELTRVIQLNVLDDIFILAQSSDYAKHQLYPKLKNLNLKYLEAYLADVSLALKQPVPEGLSDDYSPQLFTITDIEVDEIVFDSEVPPSLFGRIIEKDSVREVTIGLQFSQLNKILLTCGDQGVKISDKITEKLSDEYIEQPTVIDIEEVVGQPLVIDNCYLEVYMPQHQDETGHWVNDELDLFMVNQVFTRQDYEKNVETNELKEQLFDCFQLIDSAYTYYKHMISTGIKEREARSQAGLKDDLLFKIALLLHKINEAENQDETV